MSVPLVVVLVVAGVAAYFALTMLIIAWAGGWMALARRFPVDDTAPAFGAPFETEAARFSYVSMSLYRRRHRSAHYGGVVALTFSPTGIGLRVPRFLLWHKPVFIPWSAVGDCSEKVTLWIFRSVRVVIPELKLTLGFQGKGSQELLAAWRKHGGMLSPKAA